MNAKADEVSNISNSITITNCINSTINLNPNQFAEKYIPSRKNNSNWRTEDTEDSEYLEDEWFDGNVPSDVRKELMITALAHQSAPVSSTASASFSAPVSSTASTSASFSAPLTSTA